MKEYFCCLGIVLLSLVFSGPCLSQSAYKPGYIVDLGGKRTEVDIYDRDWVSSPERFRYRTVNGREVRQGDPTTVREFGYTDGSLRYRLFQVDIDMSGVTATRLSTSPTPEFTPMTVYLEWLVDGEADLFVWKRGNWTRYFLRTGDNPPQQLVSREYLVGDRVVDGSKMFRADLLKQLDCGVTKADVLRTEYTQRSLIKIVDRYNACRGVPTQRSVRLPRKKSLSLAIHLGAERVAGSIYEELGRNKLRYDYSPTIGPLLGVEVETLLPFSNQRWALFASAYYSRISNDSPETSPTVDYRSVSVHGGGRRYIYLSEQTALFVNAALGFQFPFSSSVTYPRPAAPRHIIVPAFRSAPLQLGAGISISRRYQLHLQYRSSQNIIQKSPEWYTRFNIIGLTGTYRFY